MSSSLKWLKPFIGGLGESLSDNMMTSSSSGDGGRFSLFIILDISGTITFQYSGYELNQALIKQMVKKFFNPFHNPLLFTHK